MEHVFTTWQKVRNPLVHGKGRTNQSDADFKNAMSAQSQIAGAMNTLILKAAGYSGYVNTSALEETYQLI